MAEKVQVRIFTNNGEKMIVERAFSRKLVESDMFLDCLCCRNETFKQYKPDDLVAFSLEGKQWQLVM